MTDRRPRTIIHGARLVPVGARPVSGPDSPVELEISGGRVTAIGHQLSRSGVDSMIDAAGRWAVPGLWDAHVHLRQWAQTRTRLDVSATTSAADVIELVRRHARTLESPDSVIFGFGHRSATWPTPATVAALDAVSGAHPVVLTSGDAHNGWLNTAAFRLLGAEPTTGALTETDWFDLMPAITRLAGELTDDQAAIRSAVADAAARGVVGITDFELAPGFAEWPERFRAGIDQLRVRPAV